MVGNESQYCIIMAGGVGSRFWPMSRQNHPKQFLDVLGTGKSLLQQTFDRFSKIIPPQNIFVVTNKVYKSLVFSQLPGLSEEQVLLEPSRRNTAPCLAYATAKIASRNPAANLVVAPSDHLIMNEESFLGVISNGFKFTADYPGLLTLGIKPNRPDTGYGYIQFNHDAEFEARWAVHKVKTFTEKPNVEIARSFIASGDFLWNSGIFIGSATSLSEAFLRFLPEMHNTFFGPDAVYYSTGEEAFIERAYAQCTNISIDYGIMEKAPNVFVIPSEFGWSDLGTWGSLYENSPKDTNGNAIVGKSVLVYDSHNCIINMPKDKLVVLHGLHDCIVVESDGILLICRKDNEQEIRQLVTNVKMQKGESYI